MATRLGRNCVAIRKHNRNPLLIYWGELMADRFSDEPVPTDAELLQDEVLAFYEDWEMTGRSKATLIAWLKARPSIAAYITDVIVQHLEEPRKEHLSEVRNPISEQLYSDIYEMYLNGTLGGGVFPSTDAQQKAAYDGKTWNELVYKQKIYRVAAEVDKTEGHVKKIISKEKIRRGD